MTRRNDELEAALLRDPANEALRLVYGDWLSSNGDVRGELIAVEHALGERPTEELVRRRALLEEEVRREILPDGFPGSVTLRYGFVDRLRVHDCDALPRIEHPAFALLRELTIEEETPRKIDLSGFPNLERVAIVASDVPCLEQVLSARLPGLRELVIELGAWQSAIERFSPLLDVKCFPHLRRLGLIFRGASLVDAVVRSARLSRLSAVGLNFGAEREALLEHKQAFAHCRFFPGRSLPPGELHNVGLFLRSRLDRPADALEFHIEAAERGSKNPQAALLLTGLATCFQMLGRHEEALEACQRAAAIDRRSRAFAAVGSAYKAEGRWVEALACYERARAIDGESPTTHHSIGHILQELGRHEEARAALKLAIILYEIRIEKDDEDSDLFWLGAAHARLGQRGAALEHLAAACRRDPRWQSEAVTEVDFSPLHEDVEFIRITS